MFWAGWKRDVTDRKGGVSCGRVVIDEDDRRDGESPSQQNRKGLLIYCFSLTDRGCHVTLFSNLMILVMQVTAFFGIKTLNSFHRLLLLHRFS